MSKPVVTMLVFVALSLASVPATQAKSVDTFSQDLFQNLEQRNVGALGNFINDRSIIRMYTVLPFGGIFQGPLEIQTFYKRINLWMNVTSLEYNLALANPYAGFSIVNCLTRGTRNVAKPAAGVDLNIDLNFQVLIDWTHTGIIRRAAVIVLDDLAVQKMIQTPAQRLLHELGIKMAEAKKGGSLDIKALEKYVAPDVVLRLHNFAHPSLLEKTEFTGLKEIHEGLAPFKKAFLDSDCVKSAKHAFCMAKFKLLMSDEHTVVFKVVLGGTSLYLPNFIVGNYTFNNQGLLRSIVLVSSVSVHPWQLGKAVETGTDNATAKPTPKPSRRRDDDERA